MFVDSKMDDHHCLPLDEVEQVWEDEFHTKHRSDAFDPLQRTATYFYIVQITFFLLGAPNDLVFVSSSCSNNFPKRKGWISFATCSSMFTLFQLRWTNQFVWLVRTPRACLPNGVERLQPWSVNLGEKKDWTVSNTTMIFVAVFSLKGTHIFTHWYANETSEEFPIGHMTSASISSIEKTDLTAEISEMNEDNLRLWTSQVYSSKTLLRI